MTDPIPRPRLPFTKTLLELLFIAAGGLQILVLMPSRDWDREMALARLAERQGRAEDAEGRFREAVGRARAEGNASHLAESLEAHAGALLELGRLPEAEVVAAAAVAVARRPGIGRGRRVRSLVLYGDICRIRAAYPAAAAAAKEATGLAVDAEETEAARLLVARLELDLGRPAEAIRILEATPDSAPARTVLGEARLRLGDLPAAEAHFRLAGDDRGLAAVALRRGDLSEAERLLAALPDDADWRGARQSRLQARLLALRGKVAEAEKLETGRGARLERLFSRQHPAYALHLLDLAQFALDRHGASDAEKAVFQAIGTLRRFFDSGHPDLGTALDLMARALLRQGRVEEAQDPADRALAICQERLGERSPDARRAEGLVVEVLDARAAFLRHADRADEAVPLEERARRIRAGGK